MAITSKIKNLPSPRSAAPHIAIARPLTPAGSYILTFLGYNAGRGRVKEWIERFGDPRDPKVDPIDWVERIPFAETRNYVQRVLENLQVYRMLFGGGSKLMIEADLHRGGE